MGRGWAAPPLSLAGAGGVLGDTQPHAPPPRALLGRVHQWLRGHAWGGSHGQGQRGRLSDGSRVGGCGQGGRTAAALPRGDRRGETPHPHTPPPPPAPPRGLAQLPGASCGSFALPKSAVRGGSPEQRGRQCTPPGAVGAQPAPRRSQPPFPGGRCHLWKAPGINRAGGGRAGKRRLSVRHRGDEPGPRPPPPPPLPVPAPGDRTGPHRRAADGARPLRSAGPLLSFSTAPSPPPRAGCPGGEPPARRLRGACPAADRALSRRLHPEPRRSESSAGHPDRGGGVARHEEDGEGGRLRGERRVAGAHYGGGGGRTAPHPRRAVTGGRPEGRRLPWGIPPPPVLPVPAAPPAPPARTLSFSLPPPRCRWVRQRRVPSTAPPLPGEEPAAVPGALPGSAGPEPCPPGHAASPRQPWAPAPPEAPGKPCPGLNSMSNTSTRKLPRAGIPELPGVGRSGPAGTPLPGHPLRAALPAPGTPALRTAAAPVAPAAAAPAAPGACRGSGRTAARCPERKRWEKRAARSRRQRPHA